MIQEGINAIIRPPRLEYDHRELPLMFDGGDGTMFMRHPLLIENQRKQNIVGSLYHSTDRHPMQGGPCIIYMHGNASSQTEGQFLVPNFCPYGIYVFCFDSVGCGCSDGEYISLGYFEKQDIDYLMEFLNNTFGLGPFILWGRSMGAATAVLARSKHLKGIICDSTFASIPILANDLVSDRKIPKFVVKLIVQFLRNKIIQIADFDLTQVSPLEAAKSSTVPAIFGHGLRDQFIPMEECDMVFDAYKCINKQKVNLRGGHNSRRERSWMKLCMEFIFGLFNISVDEVIVKEVKNLQSTEYHFESYEALVEHQKNKSKEKGSPNQAEEPKQTDEQPSQERDQTNEKIEIENNVISESDIKANHVEQIEE